MLSPLLAQLTESNLEDFHLSRQPKTEGAIYICHHLLSAIYVFGSESDALKK